MRVVLYGKLAAALGNEIEVELDGGCSVTDLRHSMANAHPGARETLLSGATRACVNDVIVPECHAIQSSDHVELLPPVSGG